MSNDWNLDFPFSPLASIPDDADMLSPGNHLDQKDPQNEPSTYKHTMLTIRVAYSLNSK